MFFNQFFLIKKIGFFVSSVGIAFIIFLVMQALISPGDLLKKTDSERTYLNFVRVDRSDDVETKKRQPPKEPPQPDTPPDTPDVSTSVENVSATNNLSMSMPSIGVPLSSGDGPYLGALSQGQGLAGFDTDVIPVVRVAPTYPRRALQAKLTGYVTLSVTINPDGTVSDAKVVESDPPRMFDRSALKAIKRWKFRPKVVNGKPVSQKAKQTIEFKLDDGK